MGKIINAALDGTKLESKQSQKWSYEDICNMEFKTILNSDCYSYDENTGLYTDLRDTDAGIQYLYDNALTLKVTGIIRPNEDADVTMLTGSIGYTSNLEKYVIEHSKDSAKCNNPQLNRHKQSKCIPACFRSGSSCSDKRNTNAYIRFDSIQKCGKERPCSCSSHRINILPKRQKNYTSRNPYPRIHERCF